MSVTIQMTFDELPEAERSRSFAESQNEPLLKLEDKYRTYVAERLAPDQKEHGADSRHFWYNNQFQPHRSRSLYHIASTSIIALSFRRDSYMVSTPRYPEMDRTIDPEMTVAEVLEWLYKKKMIGPTCCYEILDSRGVRLREDKALFDQGALPYTSLNNRRQSHLNVRLQSGLMRKAYILLIACALTGLLLGWILHHFGRVGF